MMISQERLEECIGQRDRAEAEARALRAQRDELAAQLATVRHNLLDAMDRQTELAAALRAIDARYQTPSRDGSLNHWDCSRDMHEIARAALAKVEGGK